MIEKKILGSKTLLSIAILGCLGNAFAQEEESADSDENSRELEEMVVTASRRSESLQVVPITVKAISGEEINQLGIDSFEDYISLLPGVSGAGQGPGKQEIFIRGVTAGRAAVRVAGLASEPSVATYLDETPISTGGRNIDLYVTDIDRIEVLKGPQGTLFGASSQAGTLRLITNKPVINEFQAGGILGISFTRSGETSNKVEGYVNIPMIDDKLAVRIASYSATDGGYIDNILASTQLPLTNPGLGSTVPSSRETATNTIFVEDDFNDATYRGIRVSALYQFNDDWDLLLQHTNQNLETEGIFEFEPEVSDDDLNARTFSPNVSEDEVNITTWTLNGMIGGLDVIYNGSYTERTFEGQTDYTGYAAVGPFIPYYICTYPGYDQCGNPVLSTDSFFETTRNVHEIRFATDASKPWRIIAGVFYDDLETTERTNFIYPGSINVGFFPNFPIPDASASDPNVRGPGVTFFNDFVRDREEISVFGELAFDITDDVTVSFGARSYSIEIGLQGQSAFAQRAEGPSAAAGRNVDAILEGQTPETLDDVIIKANVSWQVDQDAMLYATFSEGFRGGGFNRNGTGTTANDIPFFFDTDDVENLEFGWKTMWFDKTLRFNGAFYTIDFSGLQQGVLDFSISNLTFFDNVGEAEIDGFEAEFEWSATENLNIFGSISLIDSELTDIPDTLVNIAPKGSELPFAASSEGLIGARYTKEFGEYSWFTQGVLQWTGSRFTSLVSEDRFELPSYEQFDFTVGFGKDQWTATLYIDNLTDSLGELFAGAPDDVFRVIPTRPRTVGFRISYDY